MWVACLFLLWAAGLPYQATAGLARSATWQVHLLEYAGARQLAAQVVASVEVMRKVCAHRLVMRTLDCYGIRPCRDMDVVTMLHPRNNSTTSALPRCWHMR